MDTVNGFHPLFGSELEVDKDGAMLLDPNNPNDVEWYENDEAYDIIKD